MNRETVQPVTLTDSNFETEVLQANVPVLVDFWAEWCGPCKALGPTIEALAEDFRDHAKVGKLDVDANQVATRFGIRSIPTVILFRDGEPAKQWVGVQQKQAYADALRAALNEPETAR
jgi:thioredoxin 1